MINLTTDRRRVATLFTLSTFLFCTAGWENSTILAQVALSHPSVVGDTLPELTDDFDVLTRGPLHEAFASAHQSNPESSQSIVAAPPKLIDEVPPEYKPEGANVQWISGYWAWDEAQHDYIWISGIWRDAPPNRRWMPGYWDQANTGYRWISGFWAEETQHAQHEVGYLPQPPASIDQGPSTIAPSEQHFYVPGNWQYQNDRYRWATGHWQPMAENWIWIPARYVWTPRGCIYQSGYWDYEFDQRGTCFAPVHFNRPVYQATNYQYQPSYAINLNVDFLAHLFVRPRCSHYYYGDWYSSNFTNLGFQPWVSRRSHYRNYDPLLTYYSCRRSTTNNRYNTVQYLAQQHRSHYHRIQADELRSNRQKTQQLAKVQRDRKQREVRLASNSAELARRKAADHERRSRDRTNASRDAQSKQQAERQRREIEQRRQQQLVQQEQRTRAESQRRTADAASRDRQRRDQQQRQTADLARQQRDRQQRAEKQSREPSRNTRVARNQPSQRSKSQQDAARRAQAKAQQESAQRAQQAQRDAARRAQQKSQQDAARRAQARPQRSKFMSAATLRAREAQRAQAKAQQAQRDAARKAQQKLNSKSKKKK